jgi:carboxypeptidase T
MGVDLSRNYDYMWGLDDQGSSPDICSDRYRGPHAFSEPETQAISEFLTHYHNIKVALNMCSFGNNMNVPYNYDDQFNNDLKESHSHLYEYFLKLKRAAPTGVNFGNSARNTGHPINGEVSDYMLMKHGIIALSPELGNSDIKTNTYYI